MLENKTITSTNPKNLSKGLGRGVDALFLNPDKVSNTDKITELSVNTLVAGKAQARKSFNDVTISELAQSIKENGLIQPIIVRKNPHQNNYEIVAGERRWRAAKIAGLSVVPTIIKNINDREAVLVGLIENLQRENLNCIDEANGIAQLIKDYQITHEKCAQLLNKSRSLITNTLRLLELDEGVKELLRNGSLEMSHARALLGIEKSAQLLLANDIIKNGLSVRKIEEVIVGVSKNNNKQLKQDKNDKVINNIELKSYITEIEETIGLKLDISLKSKKDKNGEVVENGFIKIDFSNIDQLNLILKLLKG